MSLIKSEYVDDGFIVTDLQTELREKLERQHQIAIAEKKRKNGETESTSVLDRFKI